MRDRETPEMDVRHQRSLHTSPGMRFASTGLVFADMPRSQHDVRRRSCLPVRRWTRRTVTGGGALECVDVSQWE